MIFPLLWLIYLLMATYSNTERALLGSRCFRVNMGFGDEDRILTENGYIFKGNATKIL